MAVLRVPARLRRIEVALPPSLVVELDAAITQRSINVSPSRVVVLAICQFLDQVSLSHPESTVRGVPRISQFYGITILMFFGDHDPPHFHARYGGYRARFTVAGELLEGDLPHRARRLVRQWAGLHAGELAACWERAARNEVPGTIDPLP